MYTSGFSLMSALFRPSNMSLISIISPQLIAALCLQCLIKVFFQVKQNWSKMNAKVVEGEYANRPKKSISYYKSRKMHLVQWKKFYSLCTLWSTKSLTLDPQILPFIFSPHVRHWMWLLSHPSELITLFIRCRLWYTHEEKRNGALHQ